MTQGELAHAAGVDIKTVYNLESGTHLPYAKNASRIEAALFWASGALSLIAGGHEPVVVSGFPPATEQAIILGAEVVNGRIRAERERQRQQEIPQREDQEGRGAANGTNG